MRWNRFGFPQVFFSPDDGSGAASSTASSSGTSPTPSPSAPAATPSAGGGSSGASSTPAASPTHTGTGDGTPTGGAAGASLEVDFSTIFGDSDPPSGPSVEVAAAATPKVPAAEPPKPPGGAEPPKPAPAAPVPAPQVPAAAQPQGPKDAAQAASPHLDPLDPVGLATALSEHRVAAVDHIASTMFKLSAEDLEALETDVAGTIPKLLGKVFVEAQINMLAQIGRIVPAMLHREAEKIRSYAENEQAFLSRWPDLNVKDHGALIRRIALAHRQLNPQMSREQLIEEVGAMVMHAAKVAPRAAVGANGHQPPKPQPFVPAMGGAAAASNVVEANAWDVLDPANQE